MNPPATVRSALLPLLVTLLTACGGSGSGSSQPPPPPLIAPSALSYSTPVTFTMGTAIAPLSPTVSGTPAAYVVVPTLPSGLALDAATGVISGTPTAIQTASNYQITASNAGGSTSASLSIEIHDRAPDISYAQSDYALVAHTSIQVIGPANTGGAVTGWSIDRPLPNGLNFDTATGRITGTPTHTAAAQNFVVTAQNTGGSDAFTLSIAIASGAPAASEVLLELGHVSGISKIVYDGSRILSVDNAHNVALWNAQSGAIVTKLTSDCSDVDCEGQLIALAGPTAVVRNLNSFIVLTPTTGQAIAQIDAPEATVYWWRLAADGSYIASGTATGYKVWSRTGALLVTGTGDYRSANPYAAAGELRIAKGAAGAAVIETVVIPTGTSTLSPAFQGTFKTWFTDGERFISNLGNAVWVYSHAAAQLDLVSQADILFLGGSGDWMWACGYTGFKIYAVGSGGTPTASYSCNFADRLVPSGELLAQFPSSQATISIIDLAGAFPVKTNVTLATRSASAFAAVSSTDWIFGTDDGALFGDPIGGVTPKRYSFGRVDSIAGSDTRVAVATGSGDVLYFDVASHALEGDLAIATPQIGLSRDGSKLAVIGNPSAPPNIGDQTITVYSLPSETVLHQWPFTQGPNGVLEWWYPGAGDAVVAHVGNGSSDSVQVLRLDGTTLAVTPQGPELRVSPDSTRFAWTAPYPAINDVTPTNIYTGNTLTTAVNGWAVDWFDDSSLLVNRYHRNTNTYGYTRCEIVTLTGQVTACAAGVPELKRVQSLPPNAIYSPERNQIYDLTSGAVLWASAAPALRQMGTVAGNNVVFPSGTTVRIEAR